MPTVAATHDALDSASDPSHVVAMLWRSLEPIQAGAYLLRRAQPDHSVGLRVPVCSLPLVLAALQMIREDTQQTDFKLRLDLYW